MLDVNPHGLDTKPWYQHFWPWFIISMMIAVVIAIAITVSLIIKNPVSMVVDDYYNEGRAINRQLDKLNQAAVLGLAVEVSFEDTLINVAFIQGVPADKTAIRLRFYHPTLDSRDFEILVPHASQGRYRADIPHRLDGHWRLDIEPFDGQWRLSQQIELPSTKVFKVQPD